jgi:glycerol-3-phosphate dehydrogenase
MPAQTEATRGEEWPHHPVSRPTTGRVVKSEVVTMTVMAAALSPDERARALDEMVADELDVLVVGGGVVGTGSALDAVTRGLRVGLVEMNDWASGTSSRSSKLLHGGLRYLEMLDFGLVREALRERGLILKTLAPYLSRPVPFLYPLTHRGWERAYVGAGVLLYDTMGLERGASRGLPRHRHISHRRALTIAPALRPDALVGAVQYHDGQIDDARHTMLLARTAVAYGALAASRVKVVGFLREGERVTGARLHDLENDRFLEVRARQVINATGVWTDQTQAMVGERGQFRVRASKGIHLLVPRDRIRSDSGLILRTEKSVLFVIPWGRHWIVGTTDTDWELDREHPVASKHDIDYLLEQVNSVLARPLSLADIEGVYAGLRPLLAGESESTSKLSREHAVAHVAPGLVVVAGGKYTTYRVMAQDAVDAVVHGLHRRVAPCITSRTPIVGTTGHEAAYNRRHRIAASCGLHVARIEHLLARYGALYQELLALIEDDPSLAEPLPGADDYLRAEVAYAARSEGALHLEDVLARRTHISIETWDGGLEAAPHVADIMAGALGWGTDRRDHELARYRAAAVAERAARSELDDARAEAVRLAAADVVGSA